MQENKKILYVTDDIFKARVFPANKNGLNHKISFFLIVSAFSYLIVSAFKELYPLIHNLYENGYSSIDSNTKYLMLFYVGVILFSLYPIFIKHKNIYKMFFISLFFHKKIRVFRYIKYLQSLSFEHITHAFANDPNMPESTKKMISEYIVFYTLMEKRNKNNIKS